MKYGPIRLISASNWSPCEYHLVVYRVYVWTSIDHTKTREINWKFHPKKFRPPLTIACVPHHKLDKKKVRRKTNCWEKQKVRLMSWTFSILYFMLYHWITAKVLSVHTTRVFHTNLDQPKYTLHENKCQIQIAKNMDKVKGLQLQWYWQNGSMRHSHQMINLKRLNTIFVP